MIAIMSLFGDAEELLKTYEEEYYENIK